MRSSRTGKVIGANDVPRMRLTICILTSVLRTSAGIDTPRASAAPRWTTHVRGRLTEQLHEAGDGTVDRVGVDAALEPRRSLRPERQPDHRLADPGGLEPGDLEHDRGCGVGDLGVESAHDPGDADGAIGGVADEQIVPV